MNIIAQQFSNGQFELAVTPHPIDGFHVQAPGLARALNVTDAYTLLRSIPEPEKGSALVRTPGGDQQVGYVTEAGFYRALGMRQTGRIQDDMVRARVESFQNWVYREVLPSLRMTGVYEVAPALPQSYSEALRELAASIEAQQVAEARAKELEAPAQAWDVMVSAHGDYAVDEAAKILSRDPDIEIGRNRLFTFMSEIGWIYRQGARRNWHAYQSQVDNGRIVLRMTAAFLNSKTQEMENPAPTLRITAKGLEALRTALKSALVAA